MSLARFLWARRRPLEMMDTIRTWPGDLAEVRIGRQSFVLLKHPDLVHELLVGNAARIAKGHTAERRRFFAFLGEGLLNSDGDAHRRQRRLVLPSFHRSRLSSYGESMVQTTRSMLSTWREGEIRDVASDMMKLTLAVVGNTLFSSEVGATAEAVAAGFHGLVTDMNRMIFPGSPWVLRSPLPLAGRIRRSQSALDGIVYDLIRSRRANPTDTGDLLSTLLLAEDAERPGERLDDLEVRNQIMTLFFAGQGTTANALTWIFWLLAKHPEIQSALQSELSRVVGTRPPAFADVPGLTFAGQVVTEAMRLYPPVWTMGREVTEDLQLGGHPIRKGTLVLASQWVIHRDPRWFEQPADFKPERWSDAFRAGLPRFAYFPFGGGARSCIGENFAWAEMILVLAAVAGSWRLSMTQEAEGIRPQPKISLGPDRPLLLRLNRI